ncbi:MAG: LysR family transcriptional regulator [Pseudomonadota bacterium]
MRETNYLALDGTALRTFLAVFEEGSVSRAANRLGVTQSAVSHTLAKLRDVFGDPLFVRLGRGVAPTERARELDGPIRKLLDDLQGLTHRRAFDPCNEVLEFSVAANEYQRQLLFPALFRQANNAGIDVRLHFVESGVPAAALLNSGKCQLIVTPFPPDGPALIQQRLFQDEPVCYFDPSQRRAPATWPEFAACDRIDVRFRDGRSAIAVLPVSRARRSKPPICTVPTFSGLAQFVVGTQAVTVQGRFVARDLLRELAMAPLPFPVKKFAMFLVWHQRDHTDPAHHWLRQQLNKVVQSDPVFNQTVQRT